MPLTTSGSTNLNTNANGIIKRALRIVGAIGQGETPTSTQYNEGAEALNDICVELQAKGMPLWKIREYTPFAYTATNTYTIGINSTINQTAPLKILFARNVNTNVTPNLYTPMVLIPRMDYALLGIPAATGRPNQLAYTIPGAANAGTNSDMVGTITVYPTPDAYTITNVTCEIWGHVPFDNFVTLATDIPDFPSYWFNALKWSVAADLCYEYGTPPTERSMIMKQAQFHVNEALSFGTEEGSLWIQPTPQWVQGNRNM